MRRAACRKKNILTFCARDAKSAAAAVPGRATRRPCISAAAAEAPATAGTNWPQQRQFHHGVAWKLGISPSTPMGRRPELHRNAAKCRVTRFFRPFRVPTGQSHHAALNVEAGCSDGLDGVVVFRESFFSIVRVPSVFLMLSLLSGSALISKGSPPTNCCFTRESSRAWLTAWCAACVGNRSQAAVGLLLAEDRSVSRHLFAADVEPNGGKWLPSPTPQCSTNFSWPKCMVAAPPRLHSLPNVAESSSSSHWTYAGIASGSRPVPCPTGVHLATMKSDRTSCDNSSMTWGSTLTATTTASLQQLLPRQQFSSEGNRGTANIAASTAAEALQAAHIQAGELSTQEAGTEIKAATDNCRHAAAWRTINSLTERRATPNAIINADPIEHRLQLIAGHFHLVLNVPAPSAALRPLADSSPACPSDFNCAPISMDEVFKALRTMRADAAAEIDDILPRVLKMPVITGILNRSCRLVGDSTASAPERWRTSEIAAIPRKSNSSGLDNLRGIALECSLAKVLNTILRNRIQPIINQMLLNTHSGFRHGRSTAEQVAAIRCIIDACETRQKVVSIVFVDFCKAFDSVSQVTTAWLLQQHGVLPCSAIDCYFYTHYGVDARGTTIPVQCASSITSCYRTVGSVLTHNPSWKVNYTITAAVGDCGICRASPGVDCRNCTTNLCNGAEPRISLSRWMLLAVSAVATAAFMLA
uniref:Reverse transcriptase domain-containing protein n=1 Tax=Macrostomum lignano TaxID=282301 RepID=A0A1I8GXZ9_9PLAT